MDVVEMIRREGPRLVHIVDLEANIRRDEVWLDGGDVHARHLGGWVLVPELNCPSARATPDIKDSLDNGYLVNTMPSRPGEKRLVKELKIGYTSGSEMGASLSPPMM